MREGWIRRFGRTGTKLLLLAVAAPAFADTVSIVANRDTTIFDESGALGNGAGSWLFAGETNELHGSWMTTRPEGCAWITVQTPLSYAMIPTCV